MPSNRGRRRRGGITVTDHRRDGIDARIVSPTPFNETVGEARDAVFGLMQNITATGSGRLATKARNATFTIIQSVAGA